MSACARRHPRGEPPRRRSPLAESDLDEQALHIAQDSVNAALRFLDAAQAAFDRLHSFPEIGRSREFLHPELKDVRSWPIPKFEKHVVFYRLSGDLVDILRVVHSARDLDRIFGPEDR
ncbi:MAG TPA: type II toxin-antitoxin system RelE/ParE family toxin [Thermoanaerobaculia bacterium]|nr:type II toxin-antitoxin system RelE/ParE family toxin [Thermoanaerobaculia bacterium]